MCRPCEPGGISGKVRSIKGVLSGEGLREHGPAETDHEDTGLRRFLWTRQRRRSGSSFCEKPSGRFPVPSPVESA
jgi:hypothetical protein